MTPRRILKLVHQGVAPDRGRSLISAMIGLLSSRYMAEWIVGACQPARDAGVWRWRRRHEARLHVHQ